MLNKTKYLIKNPSRYKIFLFITFLLMTSLSFQSSTKADDISEFEIEGMSIGDSLFNFFDNEKINNSIVNWYDDLEKNKYISFAFDSNEFEFYDFVDVWTKYGDKEYKIYAMAGVIYFAENKPIKDINDCYYQQTSISNDLMQIFSNAEKSGPHKNIYYNADPTGKTSYTDIYFYLANDYEAVVSCYDWNKDLENKADHLYIGFRSEDFNEWLD